MEYPANPLISAHATNAQSWNIRTHWEIESGWRGHLCIAKVKELKSGRADMRCRSGQDVQESACRTVPGPRYLTHVLPKFVTLENPEDHQSSYLVVRPANAGLATLNCANPDQVTGHKTRLASADILREKASCDAFCNSVDLSVESDTPEQASRLSWMGHELGGVSAHVACGAYAFKKKVSHQKYTCVWSGARI